jgi:hypothetical protein
MDGIFVAARIAEERDQAMKRSRRLWVGSGLLVAAIALSHAAAADFELTGPDGRRFLLKDNGTWQTVETAGKDRAAEKSNEAGEAVLRLEGRTERGNGCRFKVQLVNEMHYEINSLVPYYSIYRADGVIYDTVTSPSSFTGLKPGDKQSREFEVIGIGCKDIARVQVVGGDRCVMGDLDKFTDAKGVCLARVRVLGSELVRFEK